MIQRFIREEEGMTLVELIVLLLTGLAVVGSLLFCLLLAAVMIKFIVS